MCNKRKLYNQSKNTYEFLFNEKNLKKILIYNNKIVLNLLIDNKFNKHLILSKKEIERDNNIYFQKIEIKKNNKKSKDYRIPLNIVFSSLLCIDNFFVTYKLITIDNINCYELFFN